MMQLIEIQAFDGSWQLTDNFSKILGNTMEQLRRESPVAVREMLKLHIFLSKILKKAPVVKCQLINENQNVKKNIFMIYHPI